MTRKKAGGLDLTNGPILRVLTELSLPIMASSFLATAYNITDMAWIGLLGSRAVAGVGAGGMYVWLSQGLSALCRMGGQVQTAQAIGRGDREDARHYAAGAVRLVLILGLLFGGFSVLFAEPLISFFRLEDGQSVRDAVIYTQITCGLIVFSFVNVTLTGLFTAQGDSRKPLLANLVGLAANMIFDPVLILGAGPFPRLEAAGAAIATVGAQAVVTLLLLLSIHRSSPEANILRGFRLFGHTPRRYYAAVARIGIPTALQSSIYCMISMVLTRMVADFGAAAVATQRVGGQIESLSWNTADGFGAALNAFAGQNYGAGKMDRVRKGYRISLTAMLLWGAFITLVFILFPEAISRLFFHEEEAIAISAQYLFIVGFSEIFLCVELLACGGISGLGNTRLCSLITIVLTGLRIPAAWLLCRPMGLDGIWWALTGTSMVKGVVLHLAFLRQCRKCESICP